MIFRSVVIFENVPGRMTLKLPHNLNENGIPRTPDIIHRDNYNFDIVEYSDSHITLRNSTMNAASCTLLCECSALEPDLSRWSIFTMYWPQLVACVIFGRE